jgi:coenzyme F420-0:L-glutamate ligase / coenzyme F420-1:gamma-L-glutamate ligase
MMATSGFEAFSIEPFPHVQPGDKLVDLILTALGDTRLQDGDIIVVASKVVSIEEDRSVTLATVTPSPEAVRLNEQTGKDPRVAELILRESASWRLATAHGPIISIHRLGYELTSAGVDKDTSDTAYLLPEDPDASARRLRDELTARTGTRLAVIIADSDGRADRKGSIVLAIGAAGIAPLRLTPKPGTTKQQDETLTDMITGAAGIILGQRGRNAPVVILRGITYQHSDAGIGSILHKPTPTC